MKIEDILRLKQEILNCRDEDRLLYLDINLKQLKNILTYRVSDKTSSEYSEIEIKEFKNSISIVSSYLHTVHWKLEMLKLEKETNKIDSLTNNKKTAVELLDAGFQKFLDYHLTNKALKEENANLKNQLHKQDNEMAKLKTIINGKVQEIYNALERMKK